MKGTLKTLVSPTSVNTSKTFRCTSTASQNTGVSVKIPANSIFSLTGEVYYNASPAVQVEIYKGSSKEAGNGGVGSNIKSVSYSGFTATEITVTVYGAWANANTDNRVTLKGYYTKLPSVS